MVKSNNKSNVNKNKETLKLTKCKKKIPKAIREQCWIKIFGKKYEHKCYISWCNNNINVFDFHVGHDTPESEGGTLDIDNLKPICARCNLSMSNKYTIKEWVQLHKEKTNKEQKCIRCF